MKTLILAITMCLSTAFAQKQTIEYAEWFSGKDPGEGNGQQIDIQPGDATAPMNWKTQGMPPITSHDLIYVRVKGSGFIDINGNPVNGKWSLPVAVKLTTTNFERGNFFSTSVLMNAEVRIIRPGLGYPLKKIAFPVNGAFDQVVEQLRVKLPVDSLLPGDTLMIRLQGKDEIWGDWKQMAVRQENLQLPKPFNLSVTNKSQSTPVAELDWTFTSDAAASFSIERRVQGGGWSEIKTVSGTERSYLDQEGMNVGLNYCWRVRALGVKQVMTSDYSNEACLLITDAEDTPQPLGISLSENYPNPFSQSTTLSYSLLTSDQVTLTVHDLLGREVMRLVNAEVKTPGTHQVNVSAAKLTPGVYSYRLAIKDKTLTRTMVVTR